MARLIDADRALEIVRDQGIAHPYAYHLTNYATLILREAPTVNAVEVVHAEWLYDGGSGKYFCSACDADALSFKKDDLYGGDLYEVCLTDYCPSCGAKMDGGVD